MCCCNSCFTQNLLLYKETYARGCKWHKNTLKCILKCYFKSTIMDQQNISLDEHTCRLAVKTAAKRSLGQPRAVKSLLLKFTSGVTTCVCVYECERVSECERESVCVHVSVCVCVCERERQRARVCVRVCVHVQTHFLFLIEDTNHLCLQLISILFRT